jgi:hypothetical protein
MDKRFEASQPRYDQAVVEADLCAAKGCPTKDVASGEPCGHTDEVQIVECVDVESGREKLLTQLRSGVAAVVVEGSVEGAVESGDRGNKKEQRATRNQGPTNRTQKFRWALHVLQNIYSYDSIR